MPAELQKRITTIPEDPKSKVERGVKLERTERVIYIKELIEKIGLWNLNQSELSRKLQVDRNVIKRDIDAVLEVIDIIDADGVKFELSRSYKAVVKKAWEEMGNPKLKSFEQARWAEILLSASRDATKFLEDWGVKEIKAYRGETPQPAGMSAERFEIIYQETTGGK